MSNAPAQPAKLRVGQVVRYHGSITPLRGEWFRVSGSGHKGDNTRYVLRGYWGHEANGRELTQVRRESLTYIKVETWKCPECRMEHFGAAGDNRGPCKLMQLTGSAGI